MNRAIGLGLVLLSLHSVVVAAEELASLTTLSDRELKYSVPKKPYVLLRRGPIDLIVVDNRAVDDDVLHDHKAGYSGVAQLTHNQRRENLFVPQYAGLNFEHIHDGTAQDRTILYEPRNFPMELRVINEHAAELYQKPTPNWSLESCTRYALLEDGTIEMTFECIPRRDGFEHDYIGLFWANYIHQPESLDIHFVGVGEGATHSPSWIRGVTPEHGKLSTHLAQGDDRVFKFEKQFAAALSLPFSHSQHRYSEPWYYGVSHGMAFVQMFRPVDQVRLTQSPSGGGSGNPAWDFQYFIERPAIGHRYQLRMRAMYLPFESPEQLQRVTRRHRQSLSLP
jgi:hypothetical protein